MSDQRLGSALRAVRLRRNLRQVDVADRAGVSRSLVSLLERGHLGSTTLESLREVAATLDIRVDVVARWRGGELDRLLNAGHSALEDAFARRLRGLGWEVAPEVSFAINGERGWIDLLCWHPPTRILLVIEIKTVIADVQEMIGVLDRKTRLAARIARDRGWQPEHVAALLIVADSPTNRRRVAEHAGLLKAAFAHDGRAVRAWLRKPTGRMSGLAFYANANGSNAMSKLAGRQRVRRRCASVAERATGGH